VQTSAGQPSIHISVIKRTCLSAVSMRSFDRSNQRRNRQQESGVTGSFGSVCRYSNTTISIGMQEATELDRWEERSFTAACGGFSRM